MTNPTGPLERWTFSLIQPKIPIAKWKKMGCFISRHHQVDTIPLYLHNSQQLKRELLIHYQPTSDLIRVLENRYQLQLWTSSLLYVVYRGIIHPHTVNPVEASGISNGLGNSCSQFKRRRNFGASTPRIFSPFLAVRQLRLFGSNLIHFYFYVCQNNNKAFFSLPAIYRTGSVGDWSVLPLIATKFSWCSSTGRSGSVCVSLRGCEQHYELFIDTH